MGEFKAGQWVVILFFYFTVLIIIVAASDNLYGEIYVTGEAGIEGYDNLLFMTDAACENPRFKYNPTTGESSQYNRGQVDSLDCSQSYGTLSKNDCDSITGCSWDNVTSGFWFWKSIDEGCTGYIDSDSYGVDSKVKDLFGGISVKPHDTYTAFSSSNVKSISPCNHANVVRDEELCRLFSCSWVSVDFTENYDKPSSILKTMGSVFTFKYDFGIENNLLSWILRFMFIVLPLIMLMVSVYMMLPFLH